MRERIRLKAGDGHEFGAYVAAPEEGILGGLVVIQEIFGVNAHIRSVADRFEDNGFAAVAPALFDRIEPGIELGYDSSGMARAMSFRRRLKLEDALNDVAAALRYADERTGKPAGVVGYCFGGTLAWLSATRLEPAAAVCYYGGGIREFAGEKPRCPVMLHFGTKDPHIPKVVVDQIERLHPEVSLYRYNAGHGFNCSERSSFDLQSSQDAFARTLLFFESHLAAQHS